MSEFVARIEHIPKIAEIEMGSQKLRTMLNILGLRESYLWDSRYFYCSHEDWGKVLEKVLIDMPKYTAEKFDCENFALYAAARTADLFKLNTLVIAIGQSPWGYHAWNIFVSEASGAKLFHLEPQTADIYDIMEDSGYKAEVVIFG